MPPGPPPDRNPFACHAVAPVTNGIPVTRLVAVMVEPILRCLEYRKAVMLLAATQEGGSPPALFIDYDVRQLEAENVLKEVRHPGGVATGHDKVLQTRRPDLPTA